MTNPYAHLRTLLDDEAKHIELNARLNCLVSCVDPDIIIIGDFKNWHAAVKDGINYTTSLDALIPLWPDGWNWGVDYAGGHGNCMCEAETYDGVTFHSYKQTPALAMLGCLLQVLEYEWGNKNAP